MLQRPAADSKIGGVRLEQPRRGHACQPGAIRRVHLDEIKARARIDMAIEDAQCIHGTQHITRLDVFLQEN